RSRIGSSSSCRARTVCGAARRTSARSAGGRRSSYAGRSGRQSQSALRRPSDEPRADESAARNASSSASVGSKWIFTRASRSAEISSATEVAAGAFWAVSAFRRRSRSSLRTIAVPLPKVISVRSKVDIYLFRYTIRPRLRSYGDSSTFTWSPGLIRMRYRRILPEVYPSVSCPFSRPMRYMPERNDSSTSPSTSIFSSFSAIRPPFAGRKRGAPEEHPCSPKGSRAPRSSHLQHEKGDRDVLAGNGDDRERMEELVVAEDAGRRVRPLHRIDDR